MIKTHSIPREGNPWPSAVEFACGDPATLARYCRRHGLEEHDASDGGSCHVVERKSRLTTYILVARDMAPAVRIGTLVHEAVHAAHRVLGAAGIPLTTESQEAYAYYVEWLVRRGLGVVK